MVANVTPKHKHQTADLWALESLYYKETDVEGAKLVKDMVQTNVLIKKFEALHNDSSIACLSFPLDPNRTEADTACTAL